MTTTPQAQVSEEMIERAVKAYTGLKELDDRPDTLRVKQSMRAALESALSAPPARDDVAALVDGVRKLKVTDNDKDEISVTLGGKEIRAWSYSHRQEQYWKMQMAREFVEGYYQASGAAIL